MHSASSSLGEWQRDAWERRAPRPRARNPRVTEAPPGIDPLLVPLLPPASAAAAHAFLEELIPAHVEPVIDRVIRYKLRAATAHDPGYTDAADLRQEAVLQLLAELQQFRAHPDVHSIADVRGLAAVIAYRVYARWMRRRYPGRHALKNRLYYVLTHQNGLGLWQNDGKKLVAGFATWRGRGDTASARGLERLLEQPSLAARTPSIDESRKAEMSSFLAAIFDHVGAPVEFDQLVGALSALLPVRTDPVQSDGRSEAVLALAAHTPDPAWHAEKRIFLQRLWEEVRRLPRHQRAALLLNLRDADGGGCIALFPATGIASLRQVADVLEMSAELLAELWNELPLEDTRVAELLGVSRQQVINARRGARERLARQLKGFI